MAINHEGWWKMSKSPSPCSTVGMGCGENKKLDQASIMCNCPLSNRCRRLAVGQRVSRLCVKRQLSACTRDTLGCEESASHQVTVLTDRPAPFPWTH